MKEQFVTKTTSKSQTITKKYNDKTLKDNPSKICFEKIRN